VQRRCAPSARADAQYRACGDQFVAHSLTVTYAHPHTRRGPGSAAARPGNAASDNITGCAAPARPGNAASDNITGCAASGRFVHSAQ
jgi:hypothetical protein